MRIIDKLQDILREAAVYNPEVQAAPACILWPDKESQWEAVTPRIQAEMPELFVLGEYAPDKSIGPGIWLRCVIANTLETVQFPEDKTPVIYMPGLGRQDLRAVESSVVRWEGQLLPKMQQFRLQIFSGYDFRQQEFLNFVLRHYVARGVEELDTDKLPQLIELKYHSVGDAVAELGPPDNIREVFVEFQQYLY